MALLLMLFLGYSAMSFGQASLYIEDFSLAYNENQKEVAVILDNSKEATVFQLDIQMPYGLTIDKSSITKTDRLSGRGVTLNVSEVDGKLRIAKTGGNAVDAGTGAVFTFTVNINNLLAEGEYQIELSNIVISDADAENIADAATATTTVTRGPAPDLSTCTFAADPESLEVTVGEEYQIDIMLNNEGADNLTGFSGLLTLPAGLTIVPGPDGNFIYSERTPEPLEFAFEEGTNGIAFILSSTNNTLITGTEGIIFSFKVKAGDGIAESSTIKLTKLSIGTNTALNQELADVTITVTKAAEPEIPTIPGDFGGDGEVDDGDVDTLIDALLDNTYPTDPNDPMFAIYDVNGDGEIDIADAQAAFNLSMGLNIDGTQK